MHQQRCGERKGLAHKASKPLSQRIIPTLDMSGLPRFLSYGAVLLFWNDCLVGRKVNRYSSARRGRLLESLPTGDDTFARCDLPLHMPRLAVSSGTEQSRSMPDSSFSARKTTVHPILALRTRHRQHQAQEACRSTLATPGLFFIQPLTVWRETPKVRSSPRKLLRSS